MATTTFVGRTRELDQLNGYLRGAMAGKGQVVFVSGEAGSGKTALALEFARRAQASNSALVVAVGDCNAQTGLGDPYLPFREVLSELFGDVDTKLAQGEISRENVRRLRALIARSGQVLVELGPDLIDVLLPGSRIIGMLGKAAAQKFGWLDAFEKVAQSKRNARVLEKPALEQNQICEQFARVITGLAVHQPLLLILDDLQWSDAASISLLFHLSRRIGDSPILIVGTYRPDEVAAGRDGPHPLQKVLAEIKRYSGDITVDLDKIDPAAGRQFVDGLLDAEPNGLRAGFRQALYAHTEGQPLFTIELLHEMQTRGDLVRNEAGQLVEGPKLDWASLPARIEEVIEARLGQLEEDERNLLTVAAVEGADFTVQVIAAVQGMPETAALHILADGLARRHHLVAESGMQRVGGQICFHYGFLHSLFQAYIYDQLTSAQRLLLHAAVGDKLEALYGEHAADIAPQLARHFWEAGRDDKALAYLTLAGDAAARSFANADAVLHYERALEITRRIGASSEQLISLYTRCGRALELDGKNEQALANYVDMKATALQRNDRALELAATIAGAIAIPGAAHNAANARSEFDHALALARDLDDQKAESRILWGLMLVSKYEGDAPQAVRDGEQALALARQLDLREHMAYILNDIAPLYWTEGDSERSTAAAEEAKQLWMALGNIPMLADTLSGRALGQFFAGNLDKSLELSDEAFRLSKSISQTWGMAQGRSVVAASTWNADSLPRRSPP